MSVTFFNIRRREEIEAAEKLASVSVEPVDPLVVETVELEPVVEAEPQTVTEPQKEAEAEPQKVVKPKSRKTK